MARLARLTLPGHVHHVIQHVALGRTLSADEGDLELLWDSIALAAEQHSVQVHAYVILPDRFQFLATPSEAGSVSRLLQSVGRRYVSGFNHRHGQRGAMWDGRYRSNLVEQGTHLLSCMVFLDTLPMALGLSASPEDYAWSSHRDYIGLRQDRRLVPHETYWALGNTPFAREAAYAELVQSGLNERTAKVIEDGVRHGWPLGSGEYLDELAKLTGRRLRPLKPGRPPKTR